MSHFAIITAYIMKGVIFIGRIHLVKIKPNTEEEKRFIKTLESVGVKRQSVICKQGFIFDKPYDEYLISDGLYRLIQSQIRANEES